MLAPPLGDGPQGQGGSMSIARPPLPSRERLAASRVLVVGDVMLDRYWFGGYNGALALRAAHAEAFARYAPDRKLLAAYLERWPELRREREQRERHWRLRRRSTLDLAQLHHWHGLD